MTPAPNEPMWTDTAQAWGSIIGGAGSILAVLVTGALLLFEIRSRNAETRLRNAEQRDAEAAQARLIEVALGGNGISGRGLTHVNWTIRSYSPEPIRGAMLILERLDEEGQEHFHEVKLERIPPNGVKDGQWALDPFIAWPALQDAMPLDKVRWHLEVLDVRGLIWDLEQDQLPRRVIVSEHNPRQ